MLLGFSQANSDPVLEAPGPELSPPSSEIGVLRFVGDQDAIEYTREVAIVADGDVHRGAVVPEGDRTGSPRKPNLELRLLVLREHEIEDLAALGQVDADDVRALREVHPQDLLARFAVSLHHRMSYDRIIVTDAQ